MTSPADVIRDFTADLKESVIRKSTIRAINKTATSVRAEAARRVRETINLKAAEIKDAMTLTKAVDGAGFKDLKAVITVKGRPVPLVKFDAKARNVKSARGARVGVTVKVKKERKLVGGGFLATMKTGYLGVFKRRGPGRSPIKQLFSSSIAEVFKSDDFLSGIKAFSKSRLVDVLRGELKFAVQRANAKKKG
jgi:hypothetical protein